MADVNCIDVSEYQGEVDFEEVKSQGIDSVIIRAGYGDEASQADSEFESHYQNAKSAGMNVGAYWFSYADSVENAEQEANACLEVLNGKSFNLPIFYDLEESFQTSLGEGTLTAMAIKFCETIINGGYRAGVYANLNWFENYLDYETLKASYSIWLADYGDENQLSCDIWQNSSTGQIEGVDGDVDTDVIFNEDIIDSGNTPSEPDLSMPDVYYQVSVSSGWLPVVENLENYAGIIGDPILNVAVKVSSGSVQYRVHILGGDWLPYVTGFDVDDSANGYAGNGTEIDAIEIIYYTPDDVQQEYGTLYAKYRVSPLNEDYYPYQINNETSDGQSGYAGLFGQAIDRLQIVLEQ